MKMLVLFSNPPDQSPLRLDKEDKLLYQLSRDHSEKISLDRLHASDIESIHSIISNESYNILHFSGHGSPDGIYLDKCDLNATEGELVSPQRVLDLIELAENPPLLVVFLCCYSTQLLPMLIEAAPFVISCDNEVPDYACLLFTKTFYEYLFKGRSIEISFECAIKLLKVRNIDINWFNFSRRSLIRKGSSLLIECKPDINQDSILVNLDAIREKFNSLNLSEEEFTHLFSKKLRIHYWIFNIPRERVLIPIGKLLFGEFKWENAKDIVYCTNIFRLKPNTNSKHLEIWARLLTSYNDLSSTEYRGFKNLEETSNRIVLEKACNRFNYLIERYLKPSRKIIEEIGFSQVIPNLEFAVASCERAVDYLTLEDFPRVVQELEMCLTNFHEIIDELQPASDE